MARLNNSLFIGLEDTSFWVWKEERNEISLRAEAQIGDTLHTNEIKHFEEREKPKYS